MKQARLFQVLVAPHISEKASLVADMNRQFVFEVRRDANKQEIKQAVEFLFNVKVKSVQVLNIKGKQKNFGRILGKRVSWKKAYVGLQPGYDINFRGSE
jgi:large subunit ribosomal protein L23